METNRLVFRLSCMLAGSARAVQRKGRPLADWVFFRIPNRTLLQAEGVQLVRDRLKWRPGRAASTLRSAVALCFHALLQHGVASTRPTDLQLFLSLLEDELVLTRRSACRLLRLCYGTADKVSSQNFMIS